MRMMREQLIETLTNEKCYLCGDKVTTRTSMSFTFTMSVKDPQGDLNLASLPLGNMPICNVCARKLIYSDYYLPKRTAILKIQKNLKEFINNHLGDSAPWYNNPRDINVCRNKETKNRCQNVSVTKETQETN